MEKLEKEEIVNCYEELIKQCEKNIESNVDVESNLVIKKEYEEVLSEIKSTPASYYIDIQEKINKMYDFSLCIINMLKALQPYQDDFSKV